jgi:hypothetical protein
MENMEKVSVMSLIYRSTKYMDFLAKSFNRHTANNNAELWFVGNNATEEVKEHAKEMGYNFLDFRTPYNQEKYPKNISDIYRAWNYAGFQSHGDIIVFVNSDMQFSRDWLPNLLKYLTRKTIVCSRLVESGRLPSGKHCIVKNFGRSPETFRRTDFEIYVEDIRKDKVMEGGMYMPCAIYKDVFDRSGGYPEGNIGGIPGDKIFFSKLNLMGVKHITSFNSIVYHIQLGESS